MLLYIFKAQEIKQTHLFVFVNARITKILADYSNTDLVKKKNKRYFQTTDDVS